MYLNASVLNHTSPYNQLKPNLWMQFRYLTFLHTIYWKNTNISRVCMRCP